MPRTSRKSMSHFMQAVSSAQPYAPNTSHMATPRILGSILAREVPSLGST